MKQYDCVIIDSGVDCNHRKLQDQVIYGIMISFDHVQKINISANFQDEIGHGTAIYSIIQKNSPANTSIFNIKIFEHRDEIDERLLIAALRYICDNIQCKVINISMGVKMSSDIDELYEVCKRITEKGTIILSAFDNDGAVSYPAAFDCIIGVDSSDDCLKTSDYEYIEDSVINIRGKGGYQKVLWLDPEYVIVQGTSFSCAYMSANVLNFLSNTSSTNGVEIDKWLKQNAKKVYQSHTKTKMSCDHSDFFTPVKAVLFPLNKEVHSLIAYNSLLSFEIYSALDVRQSGKINKRLRDVVNYKELGTIGEKRIGDFDSLNWDAPFDTIVLGHVGALEKLTGRKLLCNVIGSCIKHHKNLICFDDISMYSEMIRELELTGGRVYSPKAGCENFLYNRFGKLHLVNKPVVCIAGTSSSQGKFSLQLSLREKLLDEGYKVGQLGTEPTSLLYGMDEVFHYGYSVENNSCFEDTVISVNRLMHNIEKKSPDIILSGVQSGIVPYIFNNITYFTHRQLEVLAGIMPDAVVLCINPQDEIDFIKRTILTIESFLNTKVLCCSLYPIKYSEDFHTFNKKEPINADELQILVKTISERISIPVFPLNDKGIQMIYDTIIGFFSD